MQTFNICNSVAPCPHIIHIRFHQSQIWPDRK